MLSGYAITLHLVFLDLRVAALWQGLLSSFIGTLVPWKLKLCLVDSWIKVHSEACQLLSTLLRSGSSLLEVVLVLTRWGE